MRTAAKVFLVLVLATIAAAYHYSKGLEREIAERQRVTTLATSQALAPGTAVRRFIEVFPRSRPGVSLEPPRWRARALIHGRYELLASFPIHIDSGTPPQISFDEPSLVLYDLCRLDANGVGYQVDRKWTYGEDAWALLMSADGDLEVLGIPVVRDEPYPLAEEHWSAVVGGTVHALP